MTRGAKGTQAQPNLAAVGVYVAVAYALSLALSLFIGSTGGYESRFVTLGFASMIIPALAVLVVKATMNGGPGEGAFEALPLRYIPVALLLMPLVMHAVMVPLAIHLEGNVPWQSWLAPQADGFFHAPAAFGWGALTRSALAIHIALNAAIGVVIVSVLAFFEEVGWRAWMLPRMIARFGARKAVIATSVIWALWHTPYQLAGIQHIDGVSVGTMALIAPIGIVGSGLILGWLWLRTGSVWIVSLAHGALNNWGQYAFKFMNIPNVAHEEILFAAGGLALLTVGGLLLATMKPAR